MCIPAEGGGLGVGSGVVRVGFQYRVGLCKHNTAQNNTKQHNTHTSHVRTYVAPSSHTSQLSKAKECYTHTASHPLLTGLPERPSLPQRG